MNSILYLKSLNPLVIEPSPSEAMVKFAKTFTKKRDFRRAQSQLAKEKLGLSQELLYQNLGKNLADIPLPERADKYRKLFAFTSFSNKKKPLGVADAIILLLTCNATLDIRSIQTMATPLFCFELGSKKIIKRVSKYPNDQLAAILIPYNTSQKELIQWVKDSWKDIKDKNETLPQFHTNYLPQNLELGEEIIALHSKGLTFAQISEELLKKHAQDERLMDESQIRKIYHRHIDFIVEGCVNTLRFYCLSRDID